MKPGTTELLKFQRLQRRLGESLRGTVGLLDLLWQRVAKNCPQGDVGRFTNEEIAVLADWPHDPDELIAALVETRWLDACPTHRLLVHDWHEHCPNYVKGVVARKGGFYTTQGTRPRVINSESEADPESSTQGGAPPILSSPNLSSPSPSSVDTEEAEEVEKFIQEVRQAKRFVPPSTLEGDIRAAIDAGCTVTELHERILWFVKHLGWWDAEHRPGVLHTGLANARPGQPIDVGWPHAADRIAEERRQQRMNGRPVGASA